MHLIKLELIVAIYQATFSRYHFSPAMQMLLSFIRRDYYLEFAVHARAITHIFALLYDSRVPFASECDSEWHTLTHTLTEVETRLRAWSFVSVMAFPSTQRDMIKEQKAG